MEDPQLEGDEPREQQGCRGGGHGNPRVIDEHADEQADQHRQHPGPDDSRRAPQLTKRATESPAKSPDSYVRDWSAIGSTGVSSVGAAFSPVPFAKPLESEFVPTQARIEAAIRQALR